MQACRVNARPESNAPEIPEETSFFPRPAHFHVPRPGKFDEFGKLWQNAARPARSGSCHTTTRGTPITTRNSPKLTTLRRQVLNQLLDEYLQAPPNERESFVQQCQKRYPRLSRWFVPLARESRTVSDTLLAPAPSGLAELALEQFDSAGPELEPGTRLGPWAITEFVGAGGMGKVYCGIRADGAFEMDVAVKLIASSGRGLAERLREECRLLAQMDHPSISRLIDAGLTDHDEPFLVMEWVEGVDLADWLDQKQVDTSRRIEILRSVAKAVAHAHQRMVIHGDIKPGNIRVRNDGQIKLLDFGVARLLGDDPGDRGIAALTPAFAAPEQMEGAETTPASDIWALGALLKWLLTGILPRQDDGFSLLDALPGQPERRRELASIIEKACAESPEDRYTTVAGLIDDLERFQTHYPVKAYSSIAAYRWRKFARRNPVLIGGLSATFVSLIGGLVVASLLYVQAESARQQATAEQQRAERQSKELEQVVQFQSEQLSEIDTEAMGIDLRLAALDQLNRDMLQSDLTEAMSVQFTEIVEGLDYTGLALELFNEHVFDRALQTIDRQFADQPTLQARLLQTIAETLHQLGQYERSMDSASRSLEIRRELLGEEHPDTLTSIAALGRLHRDMGEYDMARERLEHALDMRRQLLGEDHLDTVESQNDLGSLLSHLAQYEDAEALFRNALDVRKRELGEDHPDTAEALNNVGNVLHESGRLPEAEPYYRQSLEILENAFGPSDGKTLRAMNNLGYLLTGLARLDEGNEVLEQHLERTRRVFGEDHPRTLRAYHNLGHGLYQARDMQNAEAHYQSALEGRLRVYGENHRLTLYTLSGIGMVLRQQGEFEQAAPYFRQALDVSENVLGPTHRITFMTHHNLAHLLANSADYEKALDHSSHAVDGLFTHMDTDHPDTLMALYLKSSILEHLERLPESQNYALMAWGVADRGLGSSHAHTLRTLRKLIGIFDLRADNAPKAYQRQVMNTFWQMRILLESEAAD